MRFSQLIRESFVESELPGQSKEEVLFNLASHLAFALGGGRSDVLGADPEKIWQLLLEREDIGTTGIGGGIAVPHGRVNGLKTSIAVLARLQQGVAFGALDDLPVHLLVGLLTPEGDNVQHLEALSAISRFFARESICEDLMAAPDRRAMHQVVLSVEWQ